MAHFYDDPQFSYLKYWQGRDYEHSAEVLAIDHLLQKHKFANAADIGGGYGRLVPVLQKYSTNVTLVEPSQKQRTLAKKLKVKIIDGISEKTNLPNSSLDLVILIRVMHHLPNPQKTLEEMHRILKPKGVMILEFANSLHFKARLKSLFTGRPILEIPVEKRKAYNIRRASIPFVNHHPKVMFTQIRESGFKINSVLSVSNFRSPFLKKIIPLPLLLVLESIAQNFLSWAYFGPSIFVLAERI